MALDVTILIPNWNGGDRLSRTMDSLAGQAETSGGVLVVDDGSSDGSDGEAERRGARVLRLGSNGGFARTVNAGWAAASTRWVLVLNNDVVLDEGCLERLVEAAEREEAWFAGPKLLRLDNPTLLDGGYDLLARSGCAWRAGHGARDNGEDVTHPVSFLPLTAALVRRELFLEAGPLDERFGSYMEDVEFFLRCARLGFEGLYVASASACHAGGATLGAWSPRMVELLSRNQLLLVALHWPREWPMLHGRAVLAGQLLWGWMAWRRGAGRAWLRGKWAALRQWDDFREDGSYCDGAEFARIVGESERELRRLQQQAGMERYWAAYFRWAGGVRP